MELNFLKTFTASNKKYSVIFTIILAILLVCSIKLYANLNKFLNTQIVLPGKSLHYFFNEGDTIKSLANYFSENANLPHPIYLIWYAELAGYTTKLKAGEYYFTGPLTPKQVLEKIKNGEVVQHKITFIEGWTFTQILNQLNNTKNIKHELTTLSLNEILLKLGIKGDYLEGLFFPNTYNYIHESSDIEILKRAHELMKQELQNAWKNRAANLPYQSPYQALIVASLIEKETALQSEQPLIAGVIINRLKKNMHLQIDPTVIYALGDNYSGKITSENLRFQSPFNTYVTKGLPPSPICMPGASAINAALHPQLTNYIYYVSKGDGSHVFSETLQQHDEAIDKYILNINNKNEKPNKR